VCPPASQTETTRFHRIHGKKRRTRRIDAGRIKCSERCRNRKEGGSGRETRRCRRTLFGICSPTGETGPKARGCKPGRTTRRVSVERREQGKEGGDGRRGIG